MVKNSELYKLYQELEFYETFILDSKNNKQTEVEYMNGQKEAMALIENNMNVLRFGELRSFLLKELEKRQLTTSQDSGYIATLQHFIEFISEKN